MTTPTEALHEIEEGSPGQRFQRLYRKRQRSPHGGLKNWLFIIAGLLIIAAGVATYPVPVIPSEIVIVIGLACLAQGSRWGARSLDHAELWFRRHFAGLIRLWKRLPRPARIAIWIAWATIASTLGFFAYRALAD